MTRTHKKLSISRYQIPANGRVGGGFPWAVVVDDAVGLKRRVGQGHVTSLTAISRDYMTGQVLTTRKETSMDLTCLLLLINEG